MKKYYILLIAAVFGLSFLSCSKEDQTNSTLIKDEIDSQIRSSPHPCDLIVAFNIEKISDQDGCCIFEITTDINDDTGLRYEVRLDGELNYFAHGPNVTVRTITVCGDQPVDISIGIIHENIYTECQSTIVNCGCECGKKPYRIAKLEDNDEGCCVYNVRATGGFSNCEGILTIGDTQYIIDQISINREVEVCPGEELIVSFTNGGILCHTDTLTCEDCCKDVESSVTNLGDTDGDGCCEWDLMIQNGDNCTKYLYDGKGIQMAEILPGGSFQFTFENCLDHDWVGQWKLYNEAGDLCEEYDMSPENCGDCCQGVELISDFIVDEDWCCTHLITAINNGDCDILLFNTNSSIQIIPPGTTIITDITICDNNSVDYFVGETLDQNKACAQVTLQPCK